jgi:penicillin-binding protein 1C
LGKIIIYLVPRIINIILISLLFIEKLILKTVPRKFLLKFSLLTFLIISTLTISFLVQVFKDLPSPQKLSDRNIEVSTKIYDRNGVLLYKIYKNKNRSPIKLNEIPENIKLATLAAEDADFYHHPGYSIKGILRSIYFLLKDQKVLSGSTITQQLVKNALLSPEKTITRKVRELILAIRAESIYTKDQILEMYLNEVPFGGSAYGIKEASLLYFGKEPKDLSLGEAALLTGLPSSPTRLSPFGTNPNLSIERQHEVLKQMLDHKFIQETDYQKALKENITFAQNKIDIKAPHFVMLIKQDLVERYGEDMVEKGGLEVTTTLDYKIQELAERTVKEEIDKIKNLNVNNGAAVVLNPSNGEVLALVGSKDYFDSAHDGQVNVALSPRQPGSAIKLINYSYALSHGFTPSTILSDTPVTFHIQGQPNYSPQNYDGKYRGDLTLRSAFAESRNIPAVKVLATYGVDKMIDLGRKMGITTWDNPSNYGLSLTLGGGEVKLIDLARAYATIANYGKRPDIKYILSIKNFQGNNIPNSKLTGFPIDNQVIDPRVAFMITDILKDNKARTPAFGPRSALIIPNHPEIAVKTGTSNDIRDNLTIGYNQNYLVAVWVGNNDNSPMARIASGITGAAPIWNKIMSNLVANQKPKSWNPPAGLVQVHICEKSGTKSCSECLSRAEWFLVENQPQKSCYLKKTANYYQESKL